MPTEVTFSTTILSVGNNAGIEVPPHVIEELGAGKRPPVMVRVGDYEYRTTVGVMGGKSLISVSAAVRRESGMAPGDAVTVHLTLAPEPREVDMPEDFAAALEASGQRPFFDGLSNSLQRMHVGLIADAKTEATRQRRIQKAVDLFAAGKQR